MISNARDIENFVMIRFESIFSVDTTSQFDLEPLGADECSVCCRTCVTVLGAKVNFLITSVGLFF